MRRLLIVSPYFPPQSTADMHRVRAILPHLQETGWEAEVLALDLACANVPLDPWLACTIPATIPVHRVRIPGSVGPWMRGSGSVGVRALRGFASAGDRLLAAGRFDLVYFSTTVFETFVLGPRWKRRFSAPFVLDYQDPWVNDYYREHRSVVPPGGRLKFATVDAIHRYMEPRTLKAAAGVTAVSSDYPVRLASRYPWFELTPVLVEPFAAATTDFELLNHIAAPLDRSARDLHWVYVGRGGTDMTKSFTALLIALRDYASADFRARLHLHFLGTSYAAAGEGGKSFEPLVRAIVPEIACTESTDRLPYSDALRTLRSADALIVPGSDDPSYTASKIYPYLLARRPLLAIFHERSSVVEVVRQAGGGVVVPFRTEESLDSIALKIASSWLSDAVYATPSDLDDVKFRPYTAAQSARRIAQFFDEVVYR